MLGIARWLGLLLLTSVLGACRPPAAPNPHFRDTSVDGRVGSQDLERLSVGKQRPEVKFVITHFADADRRRITLLDGHFYRMHDEWYWMHLLNGIGVPGSDVSPLSGHDIRSVSDAYTWAKGQSLPFDLAWSEDGRLFSGDFYLQCFGADRRFGIGSLLRVKSKQETDPFWVFQLEYEDQPSELELRAFFAVLQRALPEDIGRGLRWLTRSPFQEEMVRQLQAKRDPLARRVLLMRDVAASDRVEIYSEGITAGRVLMFKNRPPAPGTTTSEDIVVLASAPDELPAAAALITAAPQTPLAHVALLAKNRGIPDLYVEQAFTDPVLATAARDGTRVVLRAAEPNRLSLVPMSDAAFADWNAARRPSPSAGQHPNASNAVYSADLAQLGYIDISRLRPLIGGKAAGYLLLATQRRLPIPEPARVITTRAYDEHLASIRPLLDRVLRESSFESDAKVRFLLLEGMERFIDTHPGDHKTVGKFLVDQGKASQLSELVRAGGITGLIRRTQIAPATLRRLRADMTGQFGHDGAALRFRSSSTIEDIEGFNAAGLYESATGYMDSAVAPGSQERRRSVEDAIKKVWASYWGFVAFEERRRERIDHHSGAMAILVHPRFDDEQEQANGVLTFTRLPGGAAQMHVSAQFGAMSVTNPTGQWLPEVVSMERGIEPGLSPAVRRQQQSSVRSGPVLSDVQLRELFDTSAALVETARAAANQGLESPQHRRSYTLDIEFRVIPSNWAPGAAKSGETQLLVLKQARSLEPEPRGMPVGLYDEPIPRDLLARARRIDRHRCRSTKYALEYLTLLTDVRSFPDMGYRQWPYIAWVKLGGTGEVPMRWLNGDFARVEPSRVGGKGAWPFAVEFDAAGAARSHWHRLELDDDQLKLERSDGQPLSLPVECAREVVYSTAEAYLLDLIER